jgi:8-oxo-dGTP pyrophosphatase MutT (NUDIX family)
MTIIDEYTDPSVLTTGIAEGWAEPEADCTRIDWPPRQAAAAIPFKVINGRPVNPCATPRVRRGRNQLGRWGENLMADLVVTLVYRGVRHLLMVERGDSLGWAVPGGKVEAGETGLQAAIRELLEETGYRIDPGLCQPRTPRYVDDPRGSREAWAVTCLVTAGLGEVAALPGVTGGDDARRAAWIPASDYHGLETALRLDHRGGTVFTAHRDMLREHLGSHL